MSTLQVITTDAPLEEKLVNCMIIEYVTITCYDYNVIMYKVISTLIIQILLKAIATQSYANKCST